MDTTSRNRIFTDVGMGILQLNYITMKRIIFILSMMFLCVITFGQTSEEVRIVRNGNNYTVYNDSEEAYFTFLWTGQKTENKEKDIQRYFHTPHQDFSLFNLLTESTIVFPKGFTSVVGKLFLKEIPPHSNFTYAFPADAHKHDYEQYIYVEKASYIKSLFGPFINAKEIYYDGDRVTVEQIHAQAQTLEPTRE